MGTVAAIVVGVVFLVAGGSKLAAGQQWPADAAALGVTRSVALVVPWVELAIGAALVVRLLMPLPAIAALVMLLAMTVLLAGRLAAGEHPPCACFGAWSARPIGGGHLARNAVFVALAVLALWA